VEDDGCALGFDSGTDTVNEYDYSGPDGLASTAETAVQACACSTIYFGRLGPPPANANRAPGALLASLRWPVEKTPTHGLPGTGRHKGSISGGKMSRASERPEWRSRMIANRVVAAAVVAIGMGAGWRSASGQNVFQQEQDRIQNSALHQAAVAAGGILKLAKKPNPANLYPDLASLMKASDEVLVVHMVSNAGTLAPSGSGAITVHQALVIQSIKLGIPNQTIWISVPVGTVIFDHNTRATASYQGFMPPSDGDRHVVFVRHPRGQEQNGVQGAFLLNDQDQVEPAFREDALWRTYWHVSTENFLNTLTALAAAQGPH